MNTAAIKPVLLVTTADLAPEVLDMLGDFGVMLTGKRPIGDDIIALCARHRPAAVIVRYGKINARTVDVAAGNLQVTSKHGNDIDVIDQDTAVARGIAVRATAGANTAAVAEHAQVLILACAKSVLQFGACMRAGHWGKTTYKSIELDGRTLDLVGLDTVGRRAAAIGLALGMRIFAFDLYTEEVSAGAQLVALGKLYVQSDVASLYCPLAAENRKMLGRDALSCFKPGAILVNMAYGSLIDETVLVGTLASSRLRATGLDSFDVEPMTAPYPFQGVANIISSSHIDGMSDAAHLNMGKDITANVFAMIEERARMMA